MPKYIVDNGNDFAIQSLDRDFGGRLKDVFSVRGSDGVVVLASSAATDMEATLAAAFGARVRKLSFAVTEASFAGLGDTDTSEVLPLGTLPANSRVVGVNVKLATAFTGGGAGAMTVDIGTTGDADAIVDGAVLFAAAVDGQASSVPAGIAPHKYFATATVINGTFVTDVGLKELTAGAATIEILYVVLA